MPRNPESVITENNSICNASILDLSDREISIYFKSLSLDELEKLAPILRALFYLIENLKHE